MLLLLLLLLVVMFLLMMNLKQGLTLQCRSLQVPGKEPHVA